MDPLSLEENEGCCKDNAVTDCGAEECLETEYARMMTDEACRFEAAEASKQGIAAHLFEPTDPSFQSLVWPRSGRFSRLKTIITRTGS